MPFSLKRIVVARGAPGCAGLAAAGERELEDIEVVWTGPAPHGVLGAGGRSKRKLRLGALTPLTVGVVPTFFCSHLTPASVFGPQ